jgi:hypothetical protein
VDLVLVGQISNRFEFKVLILLNFLLALPLLKIVGVFSDELISKN